MSAKTKVSGRGTQRVAGLGRRPATPHPVYSLLRASVPPWFLSPPPVSALASWARAVRQARTESWPKPWPGQGFAGKREVKRAGTKNAAFRRLTPVPAWPA
jgi:hypothetical protein